MATIPFKNVIFMMHNHLSLSKSTTQLSVSASATSSSSASKDFTINYLTRKCGFTLKSAIATSRTIRVDQANIQRSDDFISLLKSHGFSDAHISKIIRRFPIILNHYRVEENLEPKLEYLVNNGFSGPLLHEVIVSNPRILGSSLSNRIQQSLHFLRSFLGTEERVKLAVKRDPRLLSNNLMATLQPNIDLFVKEGVSLDALTNFLVSHPYIMQSKFDRLVSALKFVKDLLKLRPTDPNFLLAVTGMASMGVWLLETKVQVFKDVGFSLQEVLSIFKVYPETFLLSDEEISSKLDFYFNTVKLERDDIISYPGLLGLAIETRIGPRHNVLKLLLSKKLLQEDAEIAHIFTISEDKFLSMYVNEHLQHVPSLLEMYNNDRAGKEIGLEPVHTENMDFKADRERKEGSKELQL